MPSDISRTSDDRRHAYGGVVMQQGRVVLDRDFNAVQRTVNASIADDALDFVGPCGTPDDGFLIGPPVPQGPDTVAGAAFADFTVKAGTMYVGGERAVFPPADPGQAPVPYSYFHQPDWLHPDPLVNRDLSREFVYLHLFEQDVSAVEDPDLKDVALGGPDTTQRIRLLRRVRRLPVEGAACADARAQATSRWLDELGLSFDPDTMRLLPRAALLVTFADPEEEPNECDPVARGGFLGAENQLIRVQISAPPGVPPKLLWGYDNASFLYRVTVDPDGKTLVLQQSPVDAFHVPQQGQTVEVLRCAAILASEFDETDPAQPTQPLSMVRCIAEATGAVRTLATTYVPDSRRIALDAPLGPGFDNDAPVFVRVWQAQQPLDPTSAAPIELVDFDGQTSTGLRVAITYPGNPKAVPPDGAYWMLAVRPSTPQAIYPQRFLAAPQPPDGPRQWACPLAVIDWRTPTANGAPSINDCREVFDNLVELTKRKVASGAGGCCTLTIGPDDFAADPKVLQTALNSLAGQAPATLCLKPGRYDLIAPLLLNAKHAGITIEGCPGGAVIAARSGGNVEDFVHGLIRVSGAADVGFRRLRLLPPPVTYFKANLGWAEVPNDTALSLINVEGLRSAIALRVHNVVALTVADCEFDLTPPGLAPADGGQAIDKTPRFAAGLFATGACDGLTVTRSRFHYDAIPAEGLPIWAIYGVLMTPSTQLSKPEIGTGGNVLPARLKNATLTESSFTGVTAATLVIAELGIVRVRDNTSTGTYAGFLFSWPNAVAHFGSLFDFALKQQEGQALLAIATTLLATSLDPTFSIGGAFARGFPMPKEFSRAGAIAAPTADPTGGSADVAQAMNRAQNLTETSAPGAFTPKPAATTAFQFWKFAENYRKIRNFLEGVELAALPAPPVLPSPTLHIAGNTVECASPKSFPPGPAIVVLGEFLKVDPAPSEGTAGAVLLHDNRVRSAPILAGQLPVVIVALVDRCTIAGNVITNDTPGQAPGTAPAQLPPPISLVAIRSIFDPVQIAITGNVLHGARVVPTHTPLPWDAFNATR